MVTMGRANDEKVTLVNRPHPPNIEPFSDGDDAGIYKVQANIGISVDEFTGATNIPLLKGLQLEIRILEVLQEANCSRDPTRSSNQKHHFDQGYVRDNGYTALSFDYRGDRFMKTIIFVEKSI